MTNFKIPFFVVLALLLLSNIGWIWERTTCKSDSGAICADSVCVAAIGAHPISPFFPFPTGRKQQVSKRNRAFGQSSPVFHKSNLPVIAAGGFFAIFILLLIMGEL